MIFYDFNALSKQIKKLTDKTYTDLVQKKRISQLAGYENISYFHRVFCKSQGMSPRKIQG